MVTVQESTEDRLERRREEARLQRRLTFDCWNAIHEDAIKVVCKKGHPLWGKIGYMPLIFVLRGRSSLICQKCEDYDGD